MPHRSHLATAALAAAGLFLALPAAAQQAPARKVEVTVSAFGGYLGGYGRSGDTTITAGTYRDLSSFDEEIDGGAMVGGSVKVSRGGLLSLGVALLRMNYGSNLNTIFNENGAVLLSGRTAERDLWLGRVTLGYRLPLPLPVTAFAGPALLRQDGSPNVDAISHYGFSFGAETEVALPSLPVALQLGVEDNVVFWNSSEWEDRMTARFAEDGATGASSDWTMPSSHLPQLRVGLSYRLR